MARGMSRNRIGRLHDRLAWVLAVIVPLTALPLASNRATWWLVWTAAFAAISFVALLRLAAADPSYRPRFLEHKGLFGFVLLLPAWALAQSLPFGRWLGPDLAGGFGATVSVQPDVSLSGILRFVGYILLIALTVEVATRRERVLLAAKIVYAGVCLQAVWAVLALKLLGDFSPWGAKAAYLGSATGTFVNRNSLATFLGMGIVLGLGILYERAQRSDIRSTRKGQWFATLGFVDVAVFVGLGFLFVGIVYTQSRLGLVATSVGAVIALSLMHWHAGASMRRILLQIGVVFIMIVLCVALLAAGGGVAERLLFLGSESVNRLAIYSQTLGMIAARPLAGYGMDAFGMAFEAFRAPPLLSPVTYDLAHNSYLMLWSEFGVLFGSVPILALGAAGFILWGRLRSEAGFPGIAAAGIGVLVLGGIHSLGDFSLEIPANVYLLMLVLGLGLGRRARQRVDAHAAAAPVDRGPEPSDFLVERPEERIS